MHGRRRSSAWKQARVLDLPREGLPKGRAPKQGIEPRPSDLTMGIPKKVLHSQPRRRQPDASGASMEDKEVDTLQSQTHLLKRGGSHGSCPKKNKKGAVEGDGCPGGQTSPPEANRNCRTGKMKPADADSNPLTSKDSKQGNRHRPSPFLVTQN